MPTLIKSSRFAPKWQRMIVTYCLILRKETQHHIHSIYMYLPPMQQVVAGALPRQRRVRCHWELLHPGGAGRLAFKGSRPGLVNSRLLWIQMPEGQQRWLGADSLHFQLPFAMFFCVPWPSHCRCRPHSLRVQSGAGRQAPPIRKTKKIHSICMYIYTCMCTYI